MSAKKTTFPYYKLKEGENLKSVCKKLNLDSTEILLLNNLSPKQIKEGIFIKIKIMLKIRNLGIFNIFFN